MPRQPRLVIVGYPHHIILRGNNRSAIFYNDKDKRFFIKYLKEAKEKTGSKIYAYCLMGNHVHLLIEPSTEDGLADMMQLAGIRYAQYINRTYKRTGTLWEGRFKSSVVSNDEYLLTCGKYIELNPVRAKIVKNPQDYFWSSFGVRAGERIDGLLDEDPAYKGLGVTLEERQRNYKSLFEKSIPNNVVDVVRLTTQRGGVLGDKDFIAKVSRLSGRDIVLRPIGRPKKGI